MGNFLVTIIKFALAILLLPIVIACALGFYEHLRTYPSGYDDFFVWGVGAFLIVFLFIYQFWGVFESGQRITGNLFSFAAPFTRFIAYGVPFYTAGILLVFYVCRNLLGIIDLDLYFMVFTGFTFAMHILLVAQDLQQQETSPIKPSYLFTMNIVFVTALCVVVLLLDLVVGRFTFPEFFQAVFSSAEEMYALSLDKLIR